MKASFQTLSYVALGLAGLAQAHMEMTEPAPFKSKANKYAGSDVDYSMTAPLDGSGNNFPCKGYQSLFGTDAGKPTASWAAGSSQKMTIEGGANHDGGSCQASLSFDGGKTFKVIHSYIGNCVGKGPVSYDFKVPSDTPAGEAIFAWTWFNKVGNREMYMNCAAVTIEGGSKKRADGLSDRPNIFEANIGNDCAVPAGIEVDFPNPGADVTKDGSSTGAPEGSGCDSGSGSGSDGGSDGGNDGGSATPSSTAPAGGAPSDPVDSPPAASDPPTNPPASTPAGSVPGGVFVTVDPGSPAETGAPAQPTTMQTMTKSMGGEPAEPTPEVPTTPETPTPTVPETPVGSPGSGSGSGSQHEAGSACSNEGAWNCISGSQYQRCASGAWSQAQPMAAGTTCEGGEAMALSWGAKRSFRPRWARN